MTNADRARRDWRRPARLAAFGFAVLGLLVGLPVFLNHVQSDPLGDAHAYYLAAQRLNEGVPLYHQPGATIAETYLYPPLLAILWRPLALLPMDTALAIWEIILVGALVVTFRGVRTDRRILLLAGMLALPIGWAIAIGQAEVLIAGLLSIATPFTVAFAGHLKIFPWLAALFWLMTGDRRRLVRFVAWAVGLLVFQLVLEPANTLAYLQFEWLQPVLGVRSFSPFVIHPLAYVAVLAVLVALIWRYRHHALAWPLTVGLVVLAYPRLLLYQLTTLLAMFGGPSRSAQDASHVDVAAEPVLPTAGLERTTA
jgi:hypothetical protein